MPWGQSVEAAPPAQRPSPRAGDTAGDGTGEASSSDLNLILSFRAGSEDAFDRLFARYQDYVYNVCLGILAHPDDARDCAQEVFLRVYRKVGEFRAEAAFTTWLYRVTVNVCVGQLRKRPRLAAASLEDETVREIADDGPAVGAGMERAVDEELVRRVVAQLPEDYRVVLVLRYFQNLSYEEMVQVLGFSMAQVKVKLHRARRAFARKWATLGEGAVELG
jgi:RNA polymerase sigma-70 factor (ECF subfamily)